MAELYQLSRKLERHLKGLAHHKRIYILLLLHESSNPGLLHEDLLEKTKLSQGNLSHHTSILARAGLIDKKFQGKNVMHTLSPYGKKFVSFLLTLSLI